MVPVKVDVKARPMTPGEIAMRRLIFKDAIDYGSVKFHKGAFMPGAGANAMTPFGKPHFPVKKGRSSSTRFASRWHNSC